VLQEVEAPRTSRRSAHKCEVVSPMHRPPSILGDTDGRGQLKCDGTRAETRFRLSAKWTSPFKSAGASVQSTTGSRGARISGSNAGYPMFQGSVKGTGYPLHSPVSHSLPLPCVTVCHHISTVLYSYLSRWVDPRATMWPEGLSQCIIPITPQGIESDLPASSTVTQPTAPPRTPS
jgi:hypothetical protein